MPHTASHAADDGAHEGTEYFTLTFDTVANVDLTPRVMYICVYH